MTDFIFDNFDLIFTIMLVFFIGFSLFCFANILSPTLRGKMMGKQIRATKSMLDDNYDTLRDLSNTAADLRADIQRDIYERHEDDYRNIANAKASICKDSVREMASAVKEGLSGESNVRTVYCKHCGSKIDADSAFCKHCGQKQ